MKNNAIYASAIAAVLASGVINSAEASNKDATGKEKCYGVSAVGQNDCANLAGTHGCAGQTKVDNDIGEWRLVPAGACAELGGFDQKKATKIFKSMQAKKSKE